MSILRPPAVPMPAFYCFAEMRREQMTLKHPELQWTEVLMLIGKQWADLQEDSKDKIAAIATSQQQSKQYAINLKDFEGNMRAGADSVESLAEWLLTPEVRNGSVPPLPVPQISPEPGIATTSTTTSSGTSRKRRAPSPSNDSTSSSEDQPCKAARTASSAIRVPSGMLEAFSDLVPASADMDPDTVAAVVAAAQTTSHNKKRKKDKRGLPKRSLTSWAFFVKAQRNQTLEENPDVDRSEVFAMMGAKWKRMNKKGRSKYEEQAALDKQRYREEMRRYRASHKEEPIAASSSSSSSAAAAAIVPSPAAAPAPETAPRARPSPRQAPAHRVSVNHASSSSSSGAPGRRAQQLPARVPPSSYGPPGMGFQGVDGSYPALRNEPHLQHQQQHQQQHQPQQQLASYQTSSPSMQPSGYNPYPPQMGYNPYPQNYMVYPNQFYQQRPQFYGSGFPGMPRRGSVPDGFMPGSRRGPMELDGSTNPLLIISDTSQRRGSIPGNISTIPRFRDEELPSGLLKSTGYSLKAGNENK